MTQDRRSFVGGSLFTVFRVAKPDGTFEDVQVESADAVMAVLRDPTVRKLQAGEPFFVLRGQDESAPDHVVDWTYANQHTLHPDKLSSALGVVDAMRAWTSRRRPT